MRLKQNYSKTNGALCKQPTRIHVFRMHSRNIYIFDFGRQIYSIYNSQNCFDVDVHIVQEKFSLVILSTCIS